MTLTIIEYANGYTADDIFEGDIAYRDQDKYEHEFDTGLEAVEWAVDNIRGEMSNCPCTVEEFADSGRIWISAHSEEFRHGHRMPNGLGGSWYTDTSWHFEFCTIDARRHIARALCVNRNVYGLEIA